jgi:hypothetical protein
MARMAVACACGTALVVLTRQFASAVKVGRWEIRIIRIDLTSMVLVFQLTLVLLILHRARQLGQRDQLATDTEIM